MHADKKGFTRIEAELTFTHFQPDGRAGAIRVHSFLSACICVAAFLADQAAQDW
jgi:hypothetical protein